MRERGPPASSSGRDTARERARGRWIGGSLRAGRLGLSRARRWRENEMADVRQEAVDITTHGAFLKVVISSNA